MADSDGYGGGFGGGYTSPEVFAAQQRSQIFNALLGRALQPPEMVRTPLQGLANVGNTIVSALMARQSGDELSKAYGNSFQKRNQALTDAMGAGQQQAAPGTAATNAIAGRSVDPRVQALLSNPYTAELGQRAMLAELSRQPQRGYNVNGKIIDANGNMVADYSGDAGASSPVGKLAEDLKAGRIDKPTYDALIKKETYIAPTGGADAGVYETLPADAIAKYGLPKGTVAQRNTRTGAINVISKALAAGEGDPGMFTGKSPSAAALNWLVAQGKMTPEQAANWAAGHMISGPNGQMDFVQPGALGAAGGGPTPPAVSAPPPTQDLPPGANLYDGVPGAAPQPPVAPPPATPAAPNANPPGVVTLRPGVDVQSKDNQTQANDAVRALHDMETVSKQLTDAIGDGIDYTNREQIGRVSAAKTRLITAIGAAAHVGIISPTESENFAKQIGDPTSLTSIIRHDTGILDPNEQLKGFLKQSVDNARSSARSRAAELGMTPDQFEARLAKQAAAGAGAGGATGAHPEPPPGFQVLP